MGYWSCTAVPQITRCFPWTTIIWPMGYWFCTSVQQILGQPNTVSWVQSKGYSMHHWMWDGHKMLPCSDGLNHSDVQDCTTYYATMSLYTVQCIQSHVQLLQIFTVRVAVRSGLARGTLCVSLHSVIVTHHMWELWTVLCHNLSNLNSLSVHHRT